MNLNKTSKCLLPVVVLMLLLPACATSPEGEQSSDPPVTDEARTKAEGAAVGGVLGGLLGYVFGGKSKAKSVAVGAAIGAGVGYVVADEIAKRKKKYATEEQFLDGELQHATEFNATAREYNQQLKEEIAALEAQSLQLAAQYDAGKASRSELEEQKAGIQGKIEQSQRFYAELDKEYQIKLAIYEEEDQKRDPDDEYLLSLLDEISELKANLDELHTHSVQLASIDERLIR